MLNTMEILKTLWLGIKEPLKNRRYVVLLSVVTIAMLSLFVLIPVFVIDGNDIAFQLSIFTTQEIILVSFLSVIYALYIIMQVYVFRTNKQFAKMIGESAGGGASALFAGIAGSAACSACLAPLFAFFGIGFGGVLFVLEYRLYFIVGIITLMLIAIYFTARRIKRVCNC